MTKAVSFVRTAETPMLEAAVSLSRTAKQASPAQVFVKAQDRRMTTARKKRQRKKNPLVRSDVPKRLTLGMPPIPSAPPRAGVYWKTATTMKLMPMVVMARKSCLTRRLGRPQRNPMLPTMSRTKGSACQKVSPPAVVSMALE